MGVSGSGQGRAKEQGVGDAVFPVEEQRLLSRAKSPEPGQGGGWSLSRGRSWLLSGCGCSSHIPSSRKNSASLPAYSWKSWKKQADKGRGSLEVVLERMAKIDYHDLCKAGVFSSAGVF